jgi:type I restriction enzyme S subunit
MVKLVEQLNFLPTGVKEFSGTRKYYSTGSIQEDKNTPEGDFTYHNRPSRANRISVNGDVFQARMKATDKGILVDDKLHDQLFSTGFLQLRPYGNTYNNKLLYYLIKSEQFLTQKNEYATGSTQEALTDTGASEIEIPLPPLAEQHRIVAKLDALFEKIESNKQRLEEIPKLLKRFRQSVLLASMNGKLTKVWRRENNIVDEWEIVTLKDLLSDGPQNGMYKPQSAYGSGVMILRIDNFYDGEINPWTTLKKLRVEANEYNLYSLKNDDIVINRVNSMPYLGKSALVKNLKEPCVFESNMMRMKLKLKIVSPFYLIKYLNSMQGLEELRKNAKHAVNQASINQQDVKAVSVPLPSLEEQNEIVMRVEQLFAFADKLEARYIKAKAMLNMLPQSILAKAFRGELVVQDPNDEPASVLLEKIKEEKEKLKGVKVNRKRN